MIKFTIKIAVIISISFKFSLLAYGSLEIQIFEKLIMDGKFAEAKEYGNNMLAYWVSQNDEVIRQEMTKKLQLAARMESRYYYEILKSKLEVVNKYYIHNYELWLECISLNPINNNLSTINFLMSRVYIHPMVLSANNFSIQEVSKLFERSLYDLMKPDNDELVLSILRMIALYGKKDPYFRLHILQINPELPSRGLYLLELKRALILLGEDDFLTIGFNLFIIQAWTYQVMNILFDNETYPYRREDKVAKLACKKSMDRFWENLDAAPEVGVNDQLYQDIIEYLRDLKNTSPSSEDVIGYFIDLIALGVHKDQRIKDLLEPLYDYWMEYIAPAIDKYI